MPGTAAQQSVPQRTYRFGVYRFDIALGRLESPRKTVMLRPKVAEMLAALLQASPEPLSKRELIAAVWRDTHIAEGGLARVINELRTALSEEPLAIETLPKRGYRLTLDVFSDEDLPVPESAADAGYEIPAALPAPRRLPLLRDPRLVFAGVLAPVLLVLAVLYFRTASAPFPENPPSSAEERQRLAQGEFQAGYRAWGLWSHEQMDSALEHFLRAARVAPDLWFGYTGIADAHVGRILLSPQPPPSAFDWAREAARRSVQLGPEVAAAQCALGSVALVADWDREQAELAFNRALALNGFSYTAYQRRGLLRLLDGRFGEARADFERSLELQPTHSDALVFLAYTEFCARDYDGVLNLLRELPDNPGKRREAMRVQGMSYAMKGRFAEARETFAKAEISEMDLLGAEAWVAALAGDAGAADHALGRLRAACQDQQADWCDTAVPEAALGRLDAAFASLEAGLLTRHWKMLTVAVDPRLEPLHRDPRWQALVREIRAPGNITGGENAELPDPQPGR